MKTICLAFALTRGMTGGAHASDFKRVQMLWQEYGEFQGRECLQAIATYEGVYGDPDKEEQWMRANRSWLNAHTLLVREAMTSYAEQFWEAGKAVRRAWLDRQLHVCQSNTLASYVNGGLQEGWER